MKMYERFVAEDIAIFRIQEFDPKTKKCACGNPHCLAAGKHPSSSGWQHSPVWDDETLQDLKTYKLLEHGYGVLLPSRNLLVIDVDARNGGVTSFTKLCEDFPEVSGAGMVVETGSGGGSKHLYFYLPSKMALSQSIPEYPGIDFKSTGFVIGPDSLHVSGNRYKCVVGGPEEIDAVPQILLEKLKKPERSRVDYKGGHIDANRDEIACMLSYISNDDLDYETWVRVGMAIHHALHGDGFELWVDWSAKSSKHNPDDMPMKWGSFGKAVDPATFGTLAWHAEQGGWKVPVTFTPPPEFAETYLEPISIDGQKLPFDVSSVDVLVPPGFVGEVARWIETQTRRSRRRLSVAAALFAIGNICGLKYTDDLSQVTTNLLVFCIAGSGTGKESIETSIWDIHTLCGIAGATHGGIKSEQEMTRNLIRHQASFYIQDEVAGFFSKVKNAKAKGGAAYFEGAIDEIMKIYGRANSFHTVSGDLKEETQERIISDIAKIRRKIENNEAQPADKLRVEKLEKALIDFNTGIKRPFMSMIGFTVPHKFETIADYDNAINGFIGRSLIFRESNTAPVLKDDFEKQPMTDNMKARLLYLRDDGEYGLQNPRVEFYGDKKIIPTDDEAKAMIKSISKWIDAKAQQHANDTGFESLLLRSDELIRKISLILAIPGGVRTAEHVRWAFEFVRRDTLGKIAMVSANENDNGKTEETLKSKISVLIEGDDFRPVSFIVKKARNFAKGDIEKVLEIMVRERVVLKQEKKHPVNGTVFNSYRYIGDVTH